MQRTINVAAVQMDVKPAPVLARQAASQGAEPVVFPALQAGAYKRRKRN